MTTPRELLLTSAGFVLAAVMTAGCGSSGGSTHATSNTSSTSATAATASATSATADSPTSASAPPAAESNPAGDIPDNQAYVAFSPAGGGFTVKVPEGWARTDAGAVTTFTDKLNRIRIEARSVGAAPTPSNVTATVVPQLRQAVANFTSPKVSAITREAGQAVLLTYRGDAAADPVTGKVVNDAFERYAFHQAGREVDLTLSGPVGADNVDPWRIVTDSLAWR
ncbi:hypothetical protein [Actinacidiphila rubida]|uniref:Lipoprotein n=1 Tax=Actinacidiphila rubida TaxID=310780 RepID=A0A1H8PVV3_9ACTN|nr:hypothetical protein [Actinacidiphila rubida]SEO45804.1 hypothetical protein SAMN05216267_102722 [Actinacidiphila rubida]